MTEEDKIWRYWHCPLLFWPTKEDVGGESKKEREKELAVTPVRWRLKESTFYVRRKKRRFHSLSAFFIFEVSAIPVSSKRACSKLNVLRNVKLGTNTKKSSKKWAYAPVPPFNMSKSTCKTANVLLFFPCRRLIDFFCWFLMRRRRSSETNFHTVKAKISFSPPFSPFRAEVKKERGVIMAEV